MRPLGAYIAAIVEDQDKQPRFLGAFERRLYRLAGTDQTEEQDWSRYAFAVLHFHFSASVLLYGLKRMQGILPLNRRRSEA